MAASVTLTLNVAGTGTPEGAFSTGPIVDTAPSANDVVTVLAATTAYQQLTVPAGSTHVLVYWSGLAGSLIVAGANTDTGISLGTGGGWAKLPLNSGATLWAKLGSGTGNITFRFV